MSINRLLAIAFFFALLIPASGQNQENSPYTRFGLGELTDPFFSAQGQMGGWTASYQDPYFTNYLNPASLGYLTATSMELGLYGRNNTLEDRFGKTTQWGGNLSHLSLAFPIMNPINDALNKKDRKFFWGSAITLTPFSRVSYNIRTVEFVEGVGRVRRQYSGNGGTYKLFLGNGFRYKDFSFGANFGLLMGSIENSRQIILDDFTYSFTENFRDDQVFRSFLWNAGAQYRLWLRRPRIDEAKRISRYMVFGVYGNSENNLRNELSRNYLKFSDILQVVDTILSEEGVRYNTKLPAQITMGLSYVQENKIRFGLDYSMAGWNAYNSPIDGSTLQNTWSINAGGEYIPDISSISNYFNKIRYRAGFRIAKDPRVFNDQLNLFEINAGVGLPFIVSREVSFLHLGFTYGQLSGTNAPISERFFRINFGFTFIDNTWFVKRRFY